MVSRRFLLLLVPAALVAAGIAYRLVFPTYDGPSLDARTAFQMMQEQQITLVDIRRPDEWQATGTADGAHRLDLRRPDFIAALDALVEGDRARPVALICARGVRSAPGAGSPPTQTVAIPSRSGTSRLTARSSKKAARLGSIENCWTKRW